MRMQGAILFVRDLDGMLSFYRDVLGLAPLPDTRTDSWVEFASGFCLHAVPPEVAVTIERSPASRPREESPVKLVFAVDDLAATTARLEAGGFAVSPRPWGVSDAVDPEGNVFQLRPAT